MKTRGTYQGLTMYYIVRRVRKSDGKIVYRTPIRRPIMTAFEARKVARHCKAMHPTTRVEIIRIAATIIDTM